MLVLLLGDLHLPLRAHSIPLKFRKLLVPGKIQQIICTGNVCDRETWDYLRTIAPDIRGVKGDWDESPHLPATLTTNVGPIRLGVIHGHQVLPVGDPHLLSSLATNMDVDVLVSGATHKLNVYHKDGKFFVNPGSATGAWCEVWPVLQQGDEEEEEEEDNDDKEAEAGPSKEARANQEAKTVADGSDGKDDSKEDGAAQETATDTKETAKSSATADDKTTTLATAADASTTPAKATTTSQAPRLPHPDPIPSFVLLDIQGTTIMSYIYQLIGGEVKVEKIEYKKRDPDAGAEEESQDVGEDAKLWASAATGAKPTAVGGGEGNAAGW